VIPLPCCPKCGALNPEGSTFCRMCGSLLVQPQPVPLFPQSTALRDNEIVIRLHKPDFAEKFFFFTSGIIMSIPLTILAESLSGYLTSAMPTLYATFFSVAIVAPLIEEFAKPYSLLYRHGETEKSVFTLGFLAGLGFGIVEFLLYVFVYEAPLIVRLPAILFHATNTSITAYGIATKRPIHFYMIAVALHFLVNFSAFFDPSWINAGGFIASSLISYYLSWHLYNKTRERIVE
jgi:RsiW-degrading membrane proteinase PrsW (M82 family)